MNATHFKNDYQKGDSVADYFENNKVVLTHLTSDTWFIGSKAEIALKQKIEEIGTPLKDWDVKINYGIKTGYNNAFIIDESKRAELIAQDPNSEEIIKPILRGRDIKRYGYEFAGLYLIATFPALNLNIDNYTAIRDYLKSFGKRLHQTGEIFIDENGNSTKSRKQTGNKWFETQDQIAYYPEFAKEKVVWKALSLSPSFCYIKDEIFHNDKANLLTSKSDDVKYLCGYLNSNVFQFYFNFIGVPMGQGFEYKVQFLNRIPISPITSSNRHLVEQIEALVELRLVETNGTVATNDTVETHGRVSLQTKIETQIDQLVCALYGLTEEEIAIVEESTQ